MFRAQIIVLRLIVNYYYEFTKKTKKKNLYIRVGKYTALNRHRSTGDLKIMRSDNNLRICGPPHGVEINNYTEFGISHVNQQSYLVFFLSPPIAFRTAQFFIVICRNWSATKRPKPRVTNHRRRAPHFFPPVITEKPVEETKSSFPRDLPDVVLHDKSRVIFYYRKFRHEFAKQPNGGG